MDKKYELVKEDSMEFNGRILYRIRALKDFEILTHSTIHKGDLGGYVQSENNLSQEGNCWISDDAKVYDNACVYGDACVYGNAWVYGKACVYGKAKVFDISWVGDNAQVGNDAYICNDSDYLYVKGLGRSSYRIRITFYKCRDNQIGVSYDCFNGTLDEFISKAKSTIKDNKFCKEYLAAIEMVKIHFDLV